MRDDPVFADMPLDRQSLRRRDPNAMRRAFWADTARILVAGEGSVVLAGPPGAQELAFAPPRLSALQPTEATAIFLGARGGLDYFAVPGDANTAHGLTDLRAAAGLLPPWQAAMAAYAVALVRWHARHGHCGVCGAPAPIREAGHKRVCANPACAAEHFPRTDPAIIVLVTYADRCFLARNAKHRPGMHSTLAGFVEPGESLEAAVAREAHEEAAIALTDITYRSSQPWPFPASLMIGFRAAAAGLHFTLDGEELVEGGWFSRGDLAGLLADAGKDCAFSLPGPLSISRRLIQDWIDETY